jgi:hypothetical protein
LRLLAVDRGAPIGCDTPVQPARHFESSEAVNPLQAQPRCGRQSGVTREPARQCPCSPARPCQTGGLFPSLIEEQHS